MAANKIIVKFKPEGHEDLIRAIKRLSTTQKKLTDSVKKVDSASNKAANSAGILGTRNQRLADENNKLANSFATVRSKMLLFNFAMSLGIRQVSQMAEQAAILEGMETAFGTLSGGAENATIAIDKLRGATNNTMSDFGLFQQANNAMILGVSRNSDEMAEMFDIAQRLGRALGRDTRSSVESLITGIGRQSRLMLDNIGLIVDAEKAYKVLAKSLNKNVSNLTDSERKQAFLNATMKSAREKVAEFGVETEASIDKINQLGASFENLSARIGDSATAFTPLVETMTSFLNSITSERIQRFSEAMGLLMNIAKGLAVVVAAALVPLMFGLGGVLGTVSATLGALMSTTTGTIAVVGSLAYGAIFLKDSFIDLKDAAMDYLFPAKELTEEQKRINEEFAMGADTLADLATGSSLEELSIDLERYGESLEVINNQQHRMAEERNIIDEMFANTKEGRIEAIDSMIDSINMIQEEIGVTEKLGIILQDLIDKKKELTKEDKKSVDIKRTEMQVIAESAVMSAKANASIAASAIQAASDEIKAKLAVAVANLMEDYIGKFGFLGLPLAAAAGTVVGSLFEKGVGAITGSFEDGGLVGGRRHSEGGTIIEAERGEFVMSRNAVDAIGVESLNRMNQGMSGGGAITVNVSGNVMTDDFVENELAEKVSTAIRRGISFGMS
tara:strand:+ start:2419 stop:4440 length:2022 start_codon:yes stop_codon:yes gene_type:complete